MISYLNDCGSKSLTKKHGVALKPDLYSTQNMVIHLYVYLIYLGYYVLFE